MFNRLVGFFIVAGFVYGLIRVIAAMGSGRASVCAHCHNRNRPGARFCAQCGRPQ